jgi:cytochrome c553
LQAYKKGDRKHPTMRGIAESLTDQNMADLAAYYSGHGLVVGEMAPKEVKVPSAEVAALLGKANCASCHGANFSSPISPAYPKIGGQHADYLFVALKAYKVSDNAKVGRNNPIMASMAKQYSNAELKLLANYLASVPGDMKVVPQSRFR